MPLAPNQIFNVIHPCNKYNLFFFLWKKLFFDKVWWLCTRILQLIPCVGSFGCRLGTFCHTH